MFQSLSSRFFYGETMRSSTAEACTRDTNPSFNRTSPRAHSRRIPRANIAPMTKAGKFQNTSGPHYTTWGDFRSCLFHEIWQERFLGKTHFHAEGQLLYIVEFWTTACNDGPYLGGFASALQIYARIVLSR